MTTNCCRTTRREIDEATPGDRLSGQALEHIAVCAPCAAFREERSALSELVGSLEAVDAPPDFDFRLRARLAAAKGSGRPRFRELALAPGTTAMVAVGLLVAIIGAFYFRQQTRIVDQSAPRAGVVARAVSTGSSASRTETVGSQNPNEASSAGAKGERTPAPVMARRRPGNGGARGSESATGRTRSFPKSSGITSRDFSQLPAVTMRRNDASTPSGSSSPSASIPLAAAPGPLVVSVRDDRGTMRTISLPPVSFGAQELVQSAKRAAPASQAARRVW